MGQPAARLTDMHVCPQVTVLVPHVGGPVAGPGAPTVLIGGMPAARVGDMLVCVGQPDVIALGSFTVLLAGQLVHDREDMAALDDALEFLRSQLSLTFTTEDIVEGAQAFFEKREPKWKGR